MSVLIKGMKMPASCYECVLGHAVDGCDSWYGKEVSTTARPINCPLVEVPPHGRLIDADEYINRMSNFYEEYMYDVLEEMPTIIEAEEGKTNG